MSKLEKSMGKIRNGYHGVLKFLIFGLAVVAVVSMMPRSTKFKYEYQKMRPWRHETLYAPFNFPIYKTVEQYDTELENAEKSVHPIFVYDVSSAENGREQLLYLFDTKYVGTDRDKEKYKNAVLFAFDSIQGTGITSNLGVVSSLKPGDLVDVVKNKVATEMDIKDVFTMQSATSNVKRMLDTVCDDEMRIFLGNLVLSSLRQNVIYSESMTTQAKDLARSRILPTFGMVQKDELIINTGEVVTEDKYIIINSLMEEYKNLYSETFLNNNSVVFGQVLLVSIVFLTMLMVIKSFHADLFAHVKLLFMIVSLMVVLILVSYAVVRYMHDYFNIIPVSLLAMLLMSFYDSRITIAVQIMSLLLISFAVPNPFQYFFIQLLVSLVAIYFMSKRRDRAGYFKASLAVFVAYLIVCSGFTLVFDGDFDKSYLRDIELYAGNAMLTMLALPITFFIERVFGFVTDLTLLELSNTNSPLLRRLSLEAPGTFQHVTMVADLCEDVIYHIGGNALLARTGAMYHDVGKIRNPNFFVENQNGMYNPHEDLSNVESSEIIISHVIDGIEICHEYHIPEQIIDFVRMHHGTSRTEYFYRQELHDNPDVDEMAFTYHGPIPSSKETAVLMMCDAVEAASRSMKDKTEASISELVDKIIDGQIKAGQFDNTDMTYRDINNVKKVLKKKLVNVYHPRIEYPN